MTVIWSFIWFSCLELCSYIEFPPGCVIEADPRVGSPLVFPHSTKITEERHHWIISTSSSSQRFLLSTVIIWHQAPCTEQGNWCRKVPYQGHACDGWMDGWMDGQGRKMMGIKSLVVLSTREGVGGRGMYDIPAFLFQTDVGSVVTILVTPVARLGQREWYSSSLNCAHENSTCAVILSFHMQGKKRNLRVYLWWLQMCTSEVYCTTSS